MIDRLSRRQFIGAGIVGATSLAMPRLWGAELPVIAPSTRPSSGLLVRPYLQPGASAGLGLDCKDIVWLTEAGAGDYAIDYGWAGLAREGQVKRMELNLRAPSPEQLKRKLPASAPGEPSEAIEASLRGQTEQHYYKYSATLPELPRGTNAWYRVRSGSQVIAEQHFKTRASENDSIRFVAVGDLANGFSAASAVAFQASLLKPDFLLALGDICYPIGRVSQYMEHFWRTYVNVDHPSQTNGAPLMGSTPFYTLLGNHDVDTSQNVYPDCLGAYYFFHAPTNGPAQGRWMTPISRDPQEVARFRAATPSSYPSLAFYSFDEGPVHFIVLDSNGYVKIDSPELLQWIESDLMASKSPWKIACMHAPMFHSSPGHYPEQKMRLISPLLERCGVDVVLAGHAHNYQRSKPMRFEPAPRKPGEHLVTGKYTIDSLYDGVKHTHADGMIHIVSGGGGGTLYKDPVDKLPQLMKEKYGDNWAPFTARHVVDRHSFVVCEATRDQLTLSAIDETGKEFDRAILNRA